MPIWTALLPGPCSEVGVNEAGLSRALSAEALGWWALQFTPRVARLEEAIVLDWQTSARLFGGQDRLRQRLDDGARQHGAQACAHGSTALAALARARHMVLTGSRDEADWRGLDLHTVSTLAQHAATLTRLGCRTVADVLALPRGGLSRRFGQEVLQALDQLTGQRPEAFTWLSLPAVFEARLELPGRIDTAPALLHGFQQLLPSLCAWLAGQQAGIQSLTLRWFHGRRRHGEEHGQHVIRLATPTRDTHRLSRLLAEHLQQILLAAPVEDIGLYADDIRALQTPSADLFPEQISGGGSDALLTPAARRAQQDALLALIDQLSVRLGAQHVCQGTLHADHRLELAQRWHPACEPGAKSASIPLPPWPQPSWILPEPQPLTTVRDEHGLQEHPFYQGRLRLLAGPHRVEAGWWDACTPADAVVRDYFLASSAIAGLLWVFRSRSQPDAGKPVWFLHGLFA